MSKYTLDEQLIALLANRNHVAPDKLYLGAPTVTKLTGLDVSVLELDGEVVQEGIFERVVTPEYHHPHPYSGKESLAVLPRPGLVRTGTRCVLEAQYVAMRVAQRGDADKELMSEYGYELIGRVEKGRRMTAWVGGGRDGEKKWFLRDEPPVTKTLSTEEQAEAELQARVRSKAANWPKASKP